MALSWPAEVYLEALGETLGLEVPIVAWVAWRAALPGPMFRVFAVTLGANLLTHGILWALFPWAPGPYPVRLIAFETAVFLTEALVFTWRLGWTPGLAIHLSFAVNLLTTLVGLLRG